MAPYRPGLTDAVVVISDFQEGWPPAEPPEPSAEEVADAWRRGDRAEPPPGPDNGLVRRDVPVLGGYLERLPLALVSAGHATHAEIWHHWRPPDPGPWRRDNPALLRRSFRMSAGGPPFGSASMRGFVQAFGAPRILCAWGLGVDDALLDACESSFRIYNSIDAPALRLPPSTSGRFDLVLTAAEWQSREVEARHPGMPTLVLPIGPDFADPETFRPLGLPKCYDAIYVAAAQPYKRHDVLFDALASAPRRLSALCVFGYGDDADMLRRQAAERGLAVDFIGPPGVDFAEVNRLMNLARVGVVCGVDDGAPAILTEYMLAGLPVLANASLRCGLQYILPETGRVADAASFGAALADLADAAPRMAPRATVIERWTWPHSIRILAERLADIPKGRGLLAPVRP